MTQEALQVEILRPAVKQLIRVELTSRIPELIRRAFAVATSGRPGPVLLDVPEDVCHGEHDFDPAEFVVDETTLSAPSRRTRPSRQDVERAAALLAKAKRPLILAGGGIHLSQAHSALQALAEALNCPVAHTMSGKGSIACTHPLSVGLFGRYSRIANDLIASSDCLLVVGCKLGEIATKRYALLPPTVPIIHLEVLAEEIGRTTATEVALCGDAREGLADLLDALRSDSKKIAADHKDYAGEVAPRMEKWRSEASSRLNSTEKPVNLARVLTELNRIMPKDSILVADGGFAAHWSGLLYDTKAAGRHYIADRGLAAIGYGLPGGIGASLAAPDSAVVSLTGDGGFNMAIGDLETARRTGACPTMIVVNNSASGYVKALQHTMFGGRYQSSDLVEMNYARIGEAMGCQGIRVEDPEEFAGAVKRGMEERTRPTIVDVVVTRDPAKMLPGVDQRTAPIKKGDRIA
jgi:acetolactate synthase-1/2/3 large subunit